MPSSVPPPIHPVIAHLAADGDRVSGSDLFSALSEVPDPRARRGVRHPMPTILAVALCAVLTGARSFVAIGEWRPTRRSRCWLPWAWLIARQVSPVCAEPFVRRAYRMHAQRAGEDETCRRVHIRLIEEHPSGGVWSRPQTRSRLGRTVPGRSGQKWSGQDAVGSSANSRAQRVRASTSAGTYAGSTRHRTLQPAVACSPSRQRPWCPVSSDYGQSHPSDEQYRCLAVPGLVRCCE